MIPLKPFTGYDGKPYGVGDRVEIHPSTDLWMRGARYGKVVRSSITSKDRVHVIMDNVAETVFAGSESTFRRIEG